MCVEVIMCYIIVVFFRHSVVYWLLHPSTSVDACDLYFYLLLFHLLSIYLCMYVSFIFQLSDLMKDPVANPIFFH